RTARLLSGAGERQRFGRGGRGPACGLLSRAAACRAAQPGVGRRRGLARGAGGCPAERARRTAARAVVAVACRDLRGGTAVLPRVAGRVAGIGASQPAVLSGTDGFARFVPGPSAPGLPSPAGITGCGRGGRRQRTVLWIGFG